MVKKGFKNNLDVTTRIVENISKGASLMSKEKFLGQRMKKEEDEDECN